MKHVTKKLTALVLAALLVLSLGVSAWATEGAVAAATPDVGKATVTIKDVKPGETAVVYKLVHYNETYTDYVYNVSFAKFLQKEGGLPNSATSRDLAEYFSKAGTDVTKLIEKFVAACNDPDSSYVAPSPYMQVTTAGTSVDLELEPGYYLIVPETTTDASRIYRPMTVFVRVDAGKLSVYAGNSRDPLTTNEIDTKSVTGPTMDKKVWCQTHTEWATTTDAGIGRTVEYYVKITLPNYDTVTALDLTVNDKMTGLDYVEGSAKVYGQAPDAETGKFNDAALIDGALAEVSKDEETAGLWHFSLDYNNIVPVDAAGVSTAKEIYLYYQAVVNKDALNAHSAINSASLTFANSATKQEQTTDEVGTLVFNYTLKLEKVAERNVSLEGAKFTFYKDKDKTQPVSFVAVDEENSIYRLAKDGEENTITEVPADFEIRGLSTGTCYVEETTVPTGYFAPAGIFQLELVSELSGSSKVHTGNLGNSSFTAMNTDDSGLILTAAVETGTPYAYHVTLSNSTTPILPSTGGMGTALFTVGGIALMVLAAFLFLRRKNKEN